MFLFDKDDVTRKKGDLKAVCHVSDWPLQSELNTTEFLVNLCICNKEGLMFFTFYGRRKSEDHQPFKFPIICIVIITQSNARQTAFNSHTFVDVVSSLLKFVLQKKDELVQKSILLKSVIFSNTKTLFH